MCEVGIRLKQLLGNASSSSAGKIFRKSISSALQRILILHEIRGLMNVIHQIEVNDGSSGASSQIISTLQGRVQ